MLLVSIRWLGTLFLLAMFAGRMIKEDFTSIWPQKGYTFLMGLFGLGGFGTLIYYSAYYTTAVKIGIIQGAMPAIVLVGSCWFFRTSITLIQIIGVFVTNYSTIIRIGTLTGALCSASFIYVGIRGVRSKQVASWWYLSGWLSLACGTLVLAISKFGVIPHSIWTERAHEFGIVALVVVFSFALGHRVRQIQQEKERI